MIASIMQEGFCIFKMDFGFEIGVEFDSGFVQYYEFGEPMPETVYDAITTAFEFYHSLIRCN